MKTEWARALRGRGTDSWARSKWHRRTASKASVCKARCAGARRDSSNEFSKQIRGPWLYAARHNKPSRMAAARRSLRQCEVHRRGSPSTAAGLQENAWASWPGPVDPGATRYVSTPASPQRTQDLFERRGPGRSQWHGSRKDLLQGLAGGGQPGERHGPEAVIVTAAA